MNRSALTPLLTSLLTLTALSGCGSLGDVGLNGDGKLSVYQNEHFQADGTFSRLFDASVDDTCEAARRALLSQGYVINRNSSSDVITGSKRFQPDGEVHIELVFTIVCVPEAIDSKVATAYVSALQDRYAIKKSTNSTSVGVSAIGSISVPVSSNHESLVKVASETIPAGKFYDRFFDLMQRLLPDPLLKGADTGFTPADR
ncbi:MAG: DUF2242 domain-containing protein [Burkholderiaceae bacterium]